MTETRVQWSKVKGTRVNLEVVYILVKETLVVKEVNTEKSFIKFSVSFYSHSFPCLKCSCSPKYFMVPSFFVSVIRHLQPALELQELCLRKLLKISQH